MIFSETDEEEEEEGLPMRNVEYYVGDDATLTNPDVGETGVTTVIGSVPVTVIKDTAHTKILPKAVSKEESDDDKSHISLCSHKKVITKEPTTGKKSTRPITATEAASPTGKKSKIVLIDEIFHKYRVQKEEQAKQTAKEIQRHNKTMEEIAQSTAIIDSTKTNIEIGIITKAASIDNERKSLELSMHKLEIYESLKAKGMPDDRILHLFPNLAEFAASDWEYNRRMM
jgi:hypothetical protein